MSPALILVRHAAPEQRPDIPPPEWRLSEVGREAARLLAEELAGYAPAAVVASPEPKAVETAEIIARHFALPVARDAAFAEHGRAAWPYEPDPAAVRARVLRVLAEPNLSVEGAETGAAAAARFAAGLAAHAARPLLVATHGTVLSLHLAAGGLDAPTLWRSLAMPEALVLDDGGRLLARIA